MQSKQRVAEEQGANRNEPVKVGEKVRGGWKRVGGRESCPDKRSAERERERQAVEGCIDRFKDDHALSAMVYTTLSGRSSPPWLLFATQFANRLETTPKFQGRVLYAAKDRKSVARLLANSCVKVDPDRHAAFSKASIADFLSSPIFLFFFFLPAALDRAM